jgi:hypothetical protein
MHGHNPLLMLESVPNSQLIIENSPMAVVYKKRSITEQNSVEVRNIKSAETRRKNVVGLLC